MKKYIYILLFVGIVINWDSISNTLGFSSNKYSLGNYTNKKWYSGHIGYSDAIKVSDENKTPAFIYLYTDWCNYCKKFESELLTDSEVNSTLAKFVKIKINPDNSDKDEQLYKKLNGSGFPTIMVQYGANGKINRVRAPYTKNGNKWQLMTADEFINVLQKYGS